MQVVLLLAQNGLLAKNVKIGLKTAALKEVLKTMKEGKEAEEA